MSGTDDVSERMRRDWDARAKENARAYIADHEGEGVRFGLSGMRDVCAIFADVHEHLRPEMKVLEIGCGIGRMLQFLALVFDEVHGVDVSPEMIAQGKKHLARLDNAHLHCGDGRGLAPLEDATFDLVYSYAVFQHIPEAVVIRDYVFEARRVLKPGGIFKFLVKTGAWEGEGPGDSDTWVGATLSEDQIRGWIDEAGFELINGYSEDPALTWVVVRAR